MVNQTITTHSAEETEILAHEIGVRLRGGEVIELVSDLGGGKTTFTRGLAKGAGSKSLVSSPTFTISNVYSAKNLEIHHFDFYRLIEAGLMEHELEDVLDDPKNVVVIEWSDVVKHVLPDNRLSITFITTSESDRQIKLCYPKSLAYLLEAKP